MTKKEKIWLVVSLVMFLVPEILFGFLLMWPLLLLGADLPRSASLIDVYHNQFFSDHQVYLLLACVVEWLGSLGLFIWALKNKRAKALIGLFFLICAALLVVLYFDYSLMNADFIL